MAQQNPCMPFSVALFPKDLYLFSIDPWSFQFIAGCILFFIGMAINIHSDHILRTLRKPNETGYKIPQGGMFKYLHSSQVLFAEIGQLSKDQEDCHSLHLVITSQRNLGIGTCYWCYKWLCDDFSNFC
ncbi:3-oxo-5-alpha-steroid 4-dehydrogenase 1-like [Octopus vulgaris]|uniref:3-oxo-5-alpha-steroid 4-dehydrogenase 1-like n=1 Tax=Octopus vulgaris TaxID=6645 RepID=A0AA36BAK1_OCTVU|nr:3-oxo-5-alpha-steroid 4-dehydrogenase 1-like [Octopus vulgaris]